MIQIINFFLSLIVFFQVIYIFTCGQNYMRRRAFREGVNIKLYKWVYCLLSIIGIICSFLMEQTFAMTLIYSLIIIILAIPTLGAYKSYIRSKSILNDENRQK